MTEQELRETRAMLAPGFRVCAPARPQRASKSKPWIVYCGRVRPIGAFTVVRGHPTHQCLECSRATDRARYRHDPAPAIRRARRWNDEHPDRHRAHLETSRARYVPKEPTEEERLARNEARRLRYRQNRERERATTNARRLRKKLLARANVPVEVAMPYLRWGMQAAAAMREAELAAEGKATTVGGHEALAAWMGVAPKTVQRLMGGETRSVRQSALDLLCSRDAVDFTLAEIVERAQEWAALTKDPWPFGWPTEVSEEAKKSDRAVARGIRTKRERGMLPNGAPLKPS